MCAVVCRCIGHIGNRTLLRHLVLYVRRVLPIAVSFDAIVASAVPLVLLLYQPRQTESEVKTVLRQIPMWSTKYLTSAEVKIRTGKEPKATHKTVLRSCQHGKAPKQYWPIVCGSPECFEEVVECWNLVTHRTMYDNGSIPIWPDQIGDKAKDLSAQLYQEAIMSGIPTEEMFLQDAKAGSSTDGPSTPGGFKSGGDVPMGDRSSDAKRNLTTHDSDERHPAFSFSQPGKRRSVGAQQNAQASAHEAWEKDADHQCIQIQELAANLRNKSSRQLALGTRPLRNLVSAQQKLSDRADKLGIEGYKTLAKTNIKDAAGLQKVCTACIDFGLDLKKGPHENKDHVLEQGVDAIKGNFPIWRSTGADIVQAYYPTKFKKCIQDWATTPQGKFPLTVEEEFLSVWGIAKLNSTEPHKWWTEEEQDGFQIKSSITVLGHGLDFHENKFPALTGVSLEFMMQLVNFFLSHTTADFHNELLFAEMTAVYHVVNQDVGPDGTLDACLAIVQEEGAEAGLGFARAFRDHACGKRYIKSASEHNENLHASKQVTDCVNSFKSSMDALIGIVTTVDLADEDAVKRLVENLELSNQHLATMVELDEASGTDNATAMTNTYHDVARTWQARWWTSGFDMVEMRLKAILEDNAPALDRKAFSARFKSFVQNFESFFSGEPIREAVLPREGEGQAMCNLDQQNDIWKAWELLLTSWDVIDLEDNLAFSLANLVGPGADAAQLQNFKAALTAGAALLTDFNKHYCTFVDAMGVCHKDWTEGLQPHTAEFNHWLRNTFVAALNENADASRQAFVNNLVDTTWDVICNATPETMAVTLHPVANFHRVEAHLAMAKSIHHAIDLIDDAHGFSIDAQVSDLKIQACISLLDFEIVRKKQCIDANMVRAASVDTFLRASIKSVQDLSEHMDTFQTETVKHLGDHMEVHHVIVDDALKKSSILCNRMLKTIIPSHILPLVTTIYPNIPTNWQEELCSKDLQAIQDKYLGVSSMKVISYITVLADSAEVTNDVVAKCVAMKYQAEVAEANAELTRVMPRIKQPCA